MPGSPKYTINFPGYNDLGFRRTANLDALRRLRSIDLADGDISVVQGRAYNGDGAGGLYTWSVSSTQHDDDANQIKPFDLNPDDPGCWLLVDIGQLGPAGAPGTAATIQMGTVTTGAPGTAASAVNVGNGSAALINLTIPQGPKGDKGDMPTGAMLLTDAAATTGSSLVGYKYPATGTSSRTLESFANERLSILDFAVAGEPDATGMFTRAINTVNLLEVRASISIPFGSYTISAPLPAITQDHIQFVGHGSDGSVVNLVCDGAVFTWSAYGGGLKDMTIQYPATPQANAVVALIAGGNGQIIETCRIFNVRTLAQIGTADKAGYALSIRDVLGNAFNGGSPLIKIAGQGGAGLFITGCGIYVDGVGNPAATLSDGVTANRTSTMTTVPGTNFLDAVGTKFDTIVISKGCILERWYRGLNIVTNALADLIINIFVDETTIFDYIRDDCYHFESNGDQTGGSGGIWSARLGGHCNSWEGNVVYCLGNSNNKLHEFDRLKMDFAGKHNIFLDGTLCQHIRIHRLQGGSAGRLGTTVGTSNVGDGNAYSGIKINFAEWVTITEAEAGYNGAQGGLPWQADYGVSIPADIGAFQMTGCKCDGGVAPYQIPVNTVISQNRIIANNLNALYAGNQTGKPGYALGANGDAAYLWTNRTYFNVRVSVATASNIYLNGIATGSTSGQFVLIPGENIAIDSTTPIAIFSVMP